jgi:predicted nucleic acid-binding Zn ribbon protein
MSKGDGGDISGAESSTQPKRNCIFCQKPYNGKKDSKYCSKPCFQDSQKAHSKNASLINSIIQASSQPSIETETLSTPKSVTKSKRQLSANSSIDESMSDSKKTRYEDLCSFTEDPEFSILTHSPKKPSALNSVLLSTLQRPNTTTSPSWKLS